MYILIYIDIYEYIYIFIYTCEYKYIHIYILTYIYIYMNKYICHYYIFLTVTTIIVCNVYIYMHNDAYKFMLCILSWGFVNYQTLNSGTTFYGLMFEPSAHLGGLKCEWFWSKR